MSIFLVKSMSIFLFSFSIFVLFSSIIFVLKIFLFSLLFLSIFVLFSSLIFIVKILLTPNTNAIDHVFCFLIIILASFLSILGLTNCPLSLTNLVISAFLTKSLEYFAAESPKNIPKSFLVFLTSVFSLVFPLCDCK